MITRLRPSDVDFVRIRELFNELPWDDHRFTAYAILDPTGSVHSVVYTYQDAQDALAQLGENHTSLGVTFDYDDLVLPVEAWLPTWVEIPDVTSRALRAEINIFCRYEMDGSNARMREAEARVYARDIERLNYQHERFPLEVKWGRRRPDAPLSLHAIFLDAPKTFTPDNMIGPQLLDDGFFYPPAPFFQQGWRVASEPGQK